MGAHSPTLWMEQANDGLGILFPPGLKGRRTGQRFLFEWTPTKSTTWLHLGHQVEPRCLEIVVAEHALEQIGEARVEETSDVVPVQLHGE